MQKDGILIHAHHLGTTGWEGLVWGDPATDRFGSLPTVAYLLLTLPGGKRIDTVVIGCGPSAKDGLNEAEYTLRTMATYIPRLDEFPRLKPLIAALSPAERTWFYRTLAHILPTAPLRNTHAEVRAGAALLAEHGVTTVYEVCAASHAPRCVQTVAQARVEGAIPHNQLWLTIATDMCFVGSTPDDTIILEPAHRGDDHPHGLPEALKPVIRMPGPAKEELADLITGWASHTIA